MAKDLGLDKTPGHKTSSTNQAMPSDSHAPGPLKVTRNTASIIPKNTGIAQIRRMTILWFPFMSCGARLPVYGLMTSAFFPQYAGLIVFGLYLLGPVLAIISGLILKRSVFRGEKRRSSGRIPAGAPRRT